MNISPSRGELKGGVFSFLSEPRFTGLKDFQDGLFELGFVETQNVASLHCKPMKYNQI